MSRFVTLFLLTLDVLVCLAVVPNSALAQQPLTTVKFSKLRHPAPGYFLLAPNSPDSIALIDHGGNNNFVRPAELPANFLFADSTVTHFVADKRVFLRRNAHMEVIDTLRMGGSNDLDYHEGRMLKNGNYVLLGIDVRLMDMSTLVPGGNSTARVSGALIRERTLTGVTVFEWKSLDHLPVTDATEDVDLTQPTIDYIHVNAVSEDTDGNFLISCRHLDEIVKVHRTTGQVIWRFGGSKSKGNQFTFLNDNTGFTGFSHQHDVSRTAAGRILMLDNGNLKPEKFSRAVEYELDVPNKTALMTWSFRPSPDIYAPGMGSTQELENGNIVIGWGTAPPEVVAHEVSRDGVIQAEIRTNGRPIASYRVKKALFAMSGAERIVASPGTYTFTRGDSNTRVTVVLTRVDSATSIVTERHSVLPHNLSFTDAAPCVPLPTRWTLRVKHMPKVAGSVRFDVGSLPMVIIPSKVKLYHRSVDGTGPFAPIATTYDAATKSLVVASIFPGEYAIAFPMCYDPLPTSPGQNATAVSVNPMLTWSEGLQSSGYDVELYLSNGATPLLAFTTMRLDTTVTGLLAGEYYKWRVRAKRAFTGPWSAFFTFRTRLGSPIGTEPNSLPDSIAVGLRPTFHWTSIPEATDYRLQVYTDTTSMVIDTIVRATEFRWSKAFNHHTWYQWRVRSERDTQSSEWSSSLSFVTPPAPPEARSPASEELELDPNAVSANWNGVTGGERYVLRLFKGVDPTIIHEDTVADWQSMLPVLQSVTRYYWQLQTLSRYGVSEWSQRRWFMTRGTSVLSAPHLLAPVTAENVDTVNTAFTWVPIDGATVYHMELTEHPTFDDPEFQWFEVTEPSNIVTRLNSARVYRWRVMALGSNASGTWSSTTFATLAGPNDALRPLTPVPGSAGVSTQGYASFVTDSRFAGYRAEFSKEPQFSSLAYSIGGSISPLPFLLEEGTDYWWRVVGTDNGIDLDTGVVATFTTRRPVSVQSPAIVSSKPAITIQDQHLMIRGELGGSRIQAFNLLGQLILSISVPAGVTEIVYPLRNIAKTAMIVTVLNESGRVDVTKIAVSIGTE